jgi:hypothetical protein
MNRAFFALSLLTVAVGCTATVVPGSGPGTDTTTADLATFCQDYCTRINTCDATSQLATCTSSCSSANSTAFLTIRPDVITLVDQCIAAKDCKGLLSSTVVSSCSKDAAAAVAASDAANKLCDAVAASDTKCERTPDRAGCLENAKPYTDETLTAAKSCVDKACGDVTSCLMANLAVLSSSPQVTGCAPCDKSYTCKSSGGSGGGAMSTRLSGGRCVSNGGVLECDGSISSRGNGKKVGTWKAGDGELVMNYDGASTYTCSQKAD